MILDNLPIRKNAQAENTIRACGAWMLFLPQYLPGLNLIQMVAFAKLKKRRPKLQLSLQDHRRRLRLFKPDECWNVFKVVGYASD